MIKKGEFNRIPLFLCQNGSEQDLLPARYCGLEEKTTLLGK